MIEYSNLSNSGFWSSASSTMASFWFLAWGLRRKGELDYELDEAAKRIRWLIVGGGLLTMVTATRFDSGRFVLLGWILATAFLAWPNFAYHLTRALRGIGLLSTPPSLDQQI